MASQAKRSKSSERIRRFKEHWLKDFDWLKYDGTNNRMYCDFCRTAGMSLAGGTEFVGGSNKFKRENLLAHAHSRRHKKCLDHVTSQRNPVSIQTSVIAQQFHALEMKPNEAYREKTLNELKIKFRTVYFLAKEAIPLTLFRSLLELQKANGLDINLDFVNDDQCGEILSTIASTLRVDTYKSLSESNYFAVLIDGPTDTSVLENEVVYIRVLQNGLPVNKILDLKPFAQLHTEGVLHTVKACLQDAGLDEETWKTKVVSFCADGASVNHKQRDGVVASLREDLPHLIDINFMAHRLELALLELQKCSLGQAVTDCLHLTWETYHFSPRSQSEMKEIGEELEDRIYSPVPDMSTRWMPRVDMVLKTFLQGKQDGSLVTDSGHYAAVYEHMESLASSYEIDDVKEKASELVELMSSLAFVVFCHFMADLFGEIAALSMKLQSKTLILPTAVSAVRDCIETIETMKDQPIHGGLHEKIILKCVEGRKDGNIKFQGIELKTDAFTETLAEGIETTVNLMNEELKSRFKNILGANTGNRAHEAFKSMKIFHHDTWPTETKDLVAYGTDSLEVLSDWFKVPLEAADCNVEAIPREWRQLKMLVVNSFKDKSYLDLWQVLLAKEPYKSDFKNILHLVEIMMVLPISTVDCERSFSAQRNIRSDVRSNSLSVKELADMVLISSEGPDLVHFNPSDAIEKWLSP